MLKETPFSIRPTRVINGRKIEILNPMELCQGGPEVGRLYIDAIPVHPERSFGGPIFGDSESIFLPIYTKSFFNTGFKVARIDLRNMSIKVSSKTYPLISIVGRSNNKLKFTTDIDGNNFEELDLETIK